jgi:RND family efflux transporter MFP subunit
VWFLLIGALSAAGGTASAQPPGAMAPSPVVVGEVEKRVIATGHTFVGTVTPRRVSTVGSPVDGRVDEFLVNEGDRVEANQKLAQLRVRSLQIELAGAKAELELRKRSLTQLELTKPKEIEQAEARMKAAEALLQYAESRLTRTRELHRRKTANEDDLQEHVSAAEAARRVHAERKSAYELAVSGLWDEQIAQAAAQVAVQDEVINKLDYEISRHTIEAPFAGYVSREHTEVGEWISRGGPVVEIVDLEYVDVEVPVLESYVSKIKVGQAAQVRVAALPEESYDGTVELIVPQADVRSRSFPVKVRVKNSLDSDGPLLKPGMFARVTLAVGREEPALLVPKDALVLGGENVTVWVVSPNPRSKSPGEGTVLPVPVEMGIASDGWMEVRGDLKPGQQVVVEGNERLRPGQPVKAMKRGS